MTSSATTAEKAKKESIVKSQRLSHGTLICADMTRTRRFYEDFLGLEVVRHAPSAMMFRLSTGMHVVCVECGPNKLWEMHVLHHWGVDVSTKKDVDEAYQNAIEHRDEYGIRVIRKPVMQHGVYSFYLQDLDYNWWEIQCAPIDHEAHFARGDAVDMSP